jgi:hypothetical protein
MFLKNIASLMFTVLLVTAPSLAQSVPPTIEQPAIPVEEIIRRFAEREKSFKLARANYVYRQDVRVQELNATDKVMGEYHVVSDITFDAKGKRAERIVQAPPSSLQRIGMTAEDLNDIREIQPFVLTSDDIAKYKLTYAGKETVDEIGCYLFDVEPKTLVKGERYFQGRIWVDDKDLQIVKTYGKAVPDNPHKGEENLFPKFETYREQIDEFWFPTYTRAVDTLQFSSGPVRMRQIIKYENYKKFQADIKLTFGDEVEGANGTTAPSSSNKAPALDPKIKESTTKKK